MHLGACWDALARQHRDRPAIIDDAGTWSFHEFHARVVHFGASLRALGLSKGDRVALLIPDIREYLEADYGSMASGLVRVPLDPRLTHTDLMAMLRFAGASALVTHASFAEKIAGLKQEVAGLRHIIMIGGNGPDLDYESLLQQASAEPLPEGDGDDLAALNFSGGTTGVPKAAMLRHRNLATVARNTIEGFAIDSN